MVCGRRGAWGASLGCCALTLSTTCLLSCFRWPCPVRGPTQPSVLCHPHRDLKKRQMDLLYMKMLEVVGRMGTRRGKQRSNPHCPEQPGPREAVNLPAFHPLHVRRRYWHCPPPRDWCGVSVTVYVSPASSPPGLPLGALACPALSRGVSPRAIQSCQVLSPPVINGGECLTGKRWEGGSVVGCSVVNTPQVALFQGTYPLLGGKQCLG